MSTFRVTGVAHLNVTMEVEAADENEALAIFDEEFYLTNYCGNGATDLLVGVDDERFSLDPWEGATDIVAEEQ